MTTLAQYGRARAALAKATSITEITPLLDEVEHVKLHAKQINDKALLAEANEFQDRAERRLGEVIIAAKEAGHFAAHRPTKNRTDNEQLAKATLADVGVDRKLSMRAQQAAAMPDQEFEASIERMKQRIASGAATLVDHEDKVAEKKERRAERETELATKITALPTKRYGVIVADPEWRFEPYSRETGMDRAADNHYPTSDLETIKQRDVASIAADDCVLFLWATAPMTPQALEVMQAWGFEYRSQFVWVKDRIGMGHWNRNQHELLLVGVRGNVPAPAPGEQWPSVINSAKGEHSVKPEAAMQMIESYFPNLPKIELNARETRAGWDSWGTLEKEKAA